MENESWCFSFLFDWSVTFLRLATNLGSSSSGPLRNISQQVCNVGMDKA